MLAPGHAVGDLCGQQAFDRAQQREGERRRQHFENGRVGDIRQTRPRQAVRQLAKTAADRLHRQMEQPGSKRGQYDRNQHSRPVRRQAPQQKNQGGRTNADSERCRIERWQRLPKHGEFRQQRPRFGRRQFQAAEILELAGKDRDRNAAGEADGHRMRNITDQRAEPQQADQRQHEARDENRQQQPFEAELRHGGRHEDDECAGGPADLIAAAAERRD
jgi:hypothetical protein